MAVLACVLLGAFLTAAQAAPADGVKQKEENSSDTSKEVSDTGTGHTGKYDGTFNVPSAFSEDLISEDDLYQLAAGLSTTRTFDAIDGILGSNFYYVAVESPNSPGKSISNAIVGLALAFAIIYGFIHAFQVFSRGELNLDMGVKIAMTFVLSFLFVLYCNDIANVLDRLGLGIVGAVRNTMYETVETTSDEEDSALDSILEIGEDSFKIKQTEYTLRSGIQGIAGATAVHIAANVFKKLVSSSTRLLGSLTGQEEQLDAINEKAEDAIDFLDPLSGMRSVIIGLFLQILNQLLLYAISAAAFGLYFSFALRRAFLPFAVAEVTAEGLRSPGIQYIKVYFSLYLEFAYFYIIAALANLMENFALNSPADSRSTNTILGIFGAILCIRAAATAALRKSSEFAKSVVGVH